MTIPPTRPSSTPPSKGESTPSDDKKLQKKEFKLPGKQEKDEDKKKKGLFDIAAEGQVKEMKQEVSQDMGNYRTEETSSISAKAQVNAVGQLIQRMVNQMQVGTAGGKNFASLNLEKTPEVPEAFAGSNLTISYEQNGLVIRFDNFMTPQQQQNAIFLVEAHKEQLTQMVQTLQARNIQIAELNIGNRTIALPRVEPLPPPFQPPESAGAETRRERGGGGEQQRGREGEGGPRR